MGNDPIALLQWFAATIVLVVVVTLLYVFVLGKSPPPEGVTTVSQIESEKAAHQSIASPAPEADPHPVMASAEQALNSQDFRAAVENSVRAVSLSLRRALGSGLSSEQSTMGVSDLAYLVQTRAQSSPQITQPIYQLNNLRLRAVQNQPIDQKEASWAVSFANWLIQAFESQQIKL